MGMDRRTPDYMIIEKLQREKLGGKAGIRALKYQERLMIGTGIKIV